MKKCVMMVALALAGCAGTPPPPQTITRTVLVREQVPPALLSCASAPRVPHATTQSDVADYLIQLHAAWSDCHDTVAAIRTYTDGAP